MDLNNLKVGYSAMTEEERMRLILAMRANRRQITVRRETPVAAKTKTVKTTTSAKRAIARASKAEILAALKELKNV